MIEAAVVGFRSRRDVESAAVFVAVGESPAEHLAGDLRRMLIEHVGKGAARARVTVVDHLPRLSSGKLDRAALVGLIERSVPGASSRWSGMMTVRPSPFLSLT